MGGIARELPWTYRAFLVGALALAAIPPFAGFFSKDAILSSADRPGLARVVALGRGDRRRVPHRALHVPAPLHRLLRRAHALRARAPAQGALRGPPLDDVAGRASSPSSRRSPGSSRCRAAGASWTTGSTRSSSPSRRRAARSRRSPSSPRSRPRSRGIAVAWALYRKPERPPGADPRPLPGGRPHARAQALLRRGVRPRLLQAGLRGRRLAPRPGRGAPSSSARSAGLGRASRIASDRRVARPRPAGCAGTPSRSPSASPSSPSSSSRRELMITTALILAPDRRRAGDLDRALADDERGRRLRAPRRARASWRSGSGPR